MVALIPRKYAVAIRDQQSLGRKISSHRKQTIRTCKLNRGEGQVFIKHKQRHEMGMRSSDGKNRQAITSMVAPIPLSVIASHWGFSSSYDPSLTAYFPLKWIK